MTDSPYQQIAAAVQSRGVSAALDELVTCLREQQQYHELFEALKMQVRHRLGMPALPDEAGGRLAESQQQQLEEGLLDACREVGMSLLRAGQVREAWMYLRPLEDRSEVPGVLEQIPAADENLDELIEVCLHEGAHPAWGYQLVLDNHGTCNAITTFESVVTRLPRTDQQCAAEKLVAHEHGELLTSLLADITRQEGSEPTANDSIRALIENRPTLFGEYSYHLDTTHLSATVRFARILTDQTSLRLALDLTEYGRRLNQQFQYPGEEPFLDHYPTHALYFDALLGNRIEEAVAYFRERAEAVDPEQHGSQPIEVYVELLDRLGRPGEAVQALLGFARRSAASSAQVLPLLLSLAAKADDYEPLIEYCREQNDLLGFATGLIRSHEK